MNKINKKYLAYDLKVSLKTVYRWFSGQILPNDKKIGEMSDILKIDIYEVYSFFKSKRKEFINKKSQ